MFVKLQHDIYLNNGQQYHRRPILTRRAAVEAGQLGPVRQHALAVGNRGSGWYGSVHLLHGARDRDIWKSRDPSVAAQFPARGRRSGLP